MLSERLKARCPNAQPLGQATVRHFRLSFSKKSNDRSGKATLINTAGMGNEVHGVLFRIPTSERTKLDDAEGKGNGYQRYDAFLVTRSADGTEIPATIYIAEASACDEKLRPYCWYLNLVLAGAIQHQLPAQYILELRGVKWKRDPKPKRQSRLDALEVLGKAGNPHVVGDI